MDQFLEDAVDVRAVGGFRQLGSEFRDAPGGGPGLGYLDGRLRLLARKQGAVQ
jgi:hypothetical protein